MIVGRLINWVIVIGVAYGSYQYLSTGDVTFGGPSKETVLKLANQANRNLTDKQHLATGRSCVKRSGGIIKQGIYQCEIKVFDGLISYDTPPKATYNISLTKRNGQWQLIHQSAYKPFNSTL